MVLSGLGNVCHVPALVMYPGCGPVWLGQCLSCTSPSHVPRLCSCLAWAVFSMCQSQSCTQTVVLSGLGNVCYVPALVMYPDCGLVWHGQSSVCASPSDVPRLWSCLAWAFFNVCQYTDSFQCVLVLVIYPDCGPVWHGQSSVCASSSRCVSRNIIQPPL